MQGDLAQKGNCVEICQCAHYVQWVSQQPAMLLHELSHAYHVLRLNDVDGIIKAAYEKAMASDIYETEELSGVARKSRPYCATNCAEYFAESSEAFWSSQRFHNDYFPYVHSELRGFDPIAYKMCEDVWGVVGSDLPSRAEAPRRWLERFAKVPAESIRAAFEAADVDQSGTLDTNEFGVAVASALRDPSISSEELQAMVVFTDADKDGVIDYSEFSSWLTSAIGSYVKK